MFAALADPTRRAIVARLAEGDAPVKDLVAPFALSGPAITKHLKVLERAGLISRSRAGQQRPCHLEAEALAPAADWIAQYRTMWEERLDRLDAYLKTVTRAETPRDARHPRPSAPIRPTRRRAAPAKQTRSTRRK